MNSRLPANTCLFSGKNSSKYAYPTNYLPVDRVPKASNKKWASSSFLVNIKINTTKAFINIVIRNTGLLPYMSPNLAIVTQPMTIPTRNDEPNKPILYSG